MDMTAHAILDISNIEVVYNKTIQVLRGLSLKVEAGKVVALLGSNGAGKSTTLKAISGLLVLEDGDVTSGAITFDGVPSGAAKPHDLVRRGLFHVMEGRRIFEDLTVEENLVAATYALTGRAAKPSSFDGVYEYFPRLHERRNGRAGYLSGGEQQMLAIGRALVAEPKLILLDEPSLGLSPKLVEEIFTIIARINRERGVSMLLVEQNAAVALHHGDRKDRAGRPHRAADGGPGRARILPRHGRGGGGEELPRHQALQAPQALAFVSARP